MAEIKQNLTFSYKNAVILAIICVVGVLYAGKGIKADTIDIYQNISTSVATSTWVRNWSQSFIPRHNDNGFITVKACKSGNTISTANIYICDSTGTNDTTSGIACKNTLYSRDVKTEMQSAVFPTCGQPDFYTFDLGAFTFSANVGYTFLLKTYFLASPEVSMGFANGDVYPDGIMKYAIHSGITGHDDVTVASSSDLFFQLYYGLQNSISMVAPEDGANIPDFPAWQISYDTLHASSSYSAKVYYGTNPGSLLFFDSAEVYPMSLGSWVIDKTYPFEDGLWYARATLYEDGATVATSSLISFTINATSTNDYLAGEILTVKENIDTCANIDTSSFYGGVKCAFMEVIDWAFTPSMTTKTELQKTGNDLKNSFPLNVYFDLTTSVETALSATTTASSTLGMPMIRQVGTTTEYYILPILSSSSMPNLIGQSNTALFRQTLGWAMWGGMGFLIFYQFKKKHE